MAEEPAASAETEPLLDRLCEQCWARWPEPPPESAALLRELFAPLITTATAAEVEIVLVMNPTSRPQRLRLAVVCDDRHLDSMYQQEWAELAVSASGHIYLVYRRRDGQDYAIHWDPAVTLPASLLPHLPEALAVALVDEPE